MAVDRGYGSGKPLTAAQSRGRRRVAAGQLSKSKKGNAALKKIAAENPVTGFIGGGILPAKLLKAASSLMASGQFGKAEAVRSRLAARIEGRTLSGNVNDVRMREQSTSVFPRINSTKVRTAPNRILEEQGRRRYNEMDKFNDYMSGYPTSRTPRKPPTPSKPKSIFGKLGKNILRPTNGGR